MADELEYHALGDFHHLMKQNEIKPAELAKKDKPKINDENDALKKEKALKVQKINDLFKERVAALHQEITKEGCEHDKSTLLDCQAVVEHAQPILLNMRKADKVHLLPPDFLKWEQTDIKPMNRMYLIEWIIDVHRRFRLLPETLYTTVSLIDRFLSMQHISKRQLHILGTVALLICTKYEEIYPPDCRELQIVSEGKYSRSELLYWEIEVLNVIKFEVGITSQYFFLERYHKLSDICAKNQEVFFLAQYI